MSASRKSKKYWKASRDDRTPYRSWKRYRKYQKRGLLNRESITDYLTEVGMSVSYKFTCAADPTKDFELNVHESLDLGYYIDAMTKTGFTVQGPEIKPDVIETVDGMVVIEPKVWPDTLECGHCGDTMDLVSIEKGYSCRNEECFLHFRHMEKV